MFPYVPIKTQPSMCLEVPGVLMGFSLAYALLQYSGRYALESLYKAITLFTTSVACVVVKHNFLLTPNIPSSAQYATSAH
jgi:hypothetical protein